MKGSYRKDFAPRIARILAENKGKTWREIREALRDGFPVGVRKYYPYKVWLSEIRRQRRGVPLRDDFGEGSLFEKVSP